MRRVLISLYGLAAYVFSLGTFLNAIGFVGNIGVPKSIGIGRGSSLRTAVQPTTH